MGKKKIFVISDLHLGGAKDFQMCSNQKNLADFISWVTEQKTSDLNADINLVIAGDIIDFLAEENWESFTYKELDAVAKLEKVIENFALVWTSLKNYLAAGATLTLLLGNHDIEMSLPSVRKRLLKELGAGNVDFIYDNEAFVQGDVLIEHGNRYDSWNAVDHDSLRQIRSLASRKQISDDIKIETPGSVFVTTVMNELKSKYKFIDLFKPENLAVALLLSTLEPKTVFSYEGTKNILFKGMLKAISLVKPVYVGQFLNKNNSDGMPSRKGLVSGDINDKGSEKERFEEMLIDIGYDKPSIAALTQIGTVAGGDETWGNYTRDTVKAFSRRLFSVFTAEESAEEAARKNLERIFKAFQYLVKTAKYDEKSVYTEAARFLAKDFKVIVFGHTHKALKIKLEEENPDSPVYLNSGTWADVILIPEGLLEKDSPCDDFKQFTEDLKNNRLDNWQTSKGTFVEIELDEKDKLISAEVFGFSNPKVPRVDVS